MYKEAEKVMKEFFGVQLDEFERFITTTVQHGLDMHDAVEYLKSVDPRLRTAAIMTACSADESAELKYIVDALYALNYSGNETDPKRVKEMLDALDENVHVALSLAAVRVLWAVYNAEAQVTAH